MSLSCMGAVKLCGPRERTPYLLLLMIADEADDFGVAIVSHETLAVSCRADERSIIRWVEDLEAGGWVCVRRRLWKDKCNVYFLNLPKIGVTLSPDAKLSGFHASLRKQHGDKLSPIFRDPAAVTEIPTPAAPKSVQKPVEPFFAPGRNGDSGEFSGDIPQPAMVTAERGLVTNEGRIGDKLCHPSHCPVNPVVDGPAENVVPDSPLPPAGGCRDLEASDSVEKAADQDGDAFAIHAAAESDFALLKVRLKQDLLDTPSFPYFRPVKPTENDYDACFRSWWFVRLDVKDKLWLFVTEAADLACSVVGLDKYHVRLERLARGIFRIPREYQVRFTVRQLEETQCA